MTEFGCPFASLGIPIAPVGCPVRERLPDVWFTTTLEIGLTLTVHAAGTDPSSGALPPRTWRCHVQTYEPLMIFLEIEPLSEDGIALALEAQSRWGETLGQLGRASGTDLEEEVRRRLAKTLNEAFEDEDVLRQRTFDVLKMVRDAEER